MRLLFCLLALTMSVGALAENPSTNYIPGRPKLALMRATSFTLLSLNPKRDIKTARSSESFQFYEVYGEAIFSAAPDMKLIRDTLLKNVADYDEGDATCCFEPRHGLRALFDGKAYDFLICYECSKLRIVCDQKHIVTLGISGSPEPLNQLLRARRVRLAPPPESTRRVGETALESN